MKGFAEKKVPGGKLVSVRVQYSTVIEKVEILGDFFIHPEEALEEIEKSLKGARIDSPQEELAATVARIVKEKNAEMVGITPEAIAEVIRMAIK